MDWIKNHRKDICAVVLFLTLAINFVFLIQPILGNYSGIYEGEIEGKRFFVSLDEDGYTTLRHVHVNSVFSLTYYFENTPYRLYNQLAIIGQIVMSSVTVTCIYVLFIRKAKKKAEPPLEDEYDLESLKAWKKNNGERYD